MDAVFIQSSSYFSPLRDSSMSECGGDDDDEGVVGVMEVVVDLSDCLTGVGGC